MGATLALSSLESNYAGGREYFEQIINSLDFGGEGHSMDMSQLEREFEKRGRELLRILIQEHLTQRSAGECKVPVFDSDGDKRTRTSKHDRKIETVFGRVELNRIGYIKEEEKSLHPLDAELNLSPGLYSLELEHRVAQSGTGGRKKFL